MHIRGELKVHSRFRQRQVADCHRVNAKPCGAEFVSGRLTQPAGKLAPQPPLAAIDHVLDLALPDSSRRLVIKTNEIGEEQEHIRHPIS